MVKKKRSIRLDRPNVVGTIHSWGGLAEARDTGVSIVEARVDMLPSKLQPRDLAFLPMPVILTVRSHDEGGARVLSPAVRLGLYDRFLETSQAIDLEVRSARSFSRLIARAREQHRLVILSFHDFEGTPSAKELRKWEISARSAGADIVKFATHTETPADVASLLELQDSASGPLAVMGMGNLGRASRLLFAKAGSVLNYGWLHRPQVPGQWGACEFADLLARA